ncbi:MAG: DUF2520 domain-containing protein, partial [Actinomycetia bacterium]|nr:DUF2520 domain-containing protein [Actinomycetes bacterium]
VSLIYLGTDIYKSIGINEKIAVKAFKPLLEGTFRNIENRGVTESLTGPIQRGDEETIKKHLKAVEKKLPERLDVYKVMGRLTAEVALKKGLSKEAHDRIVAILGS